MKFSCDRCGKRFSSVDEPMPGRVYRIRCRCGNTIEIAAPRVVHDAARHAKGGTPPRSASDAAGAKSATPAGEGPVRKERTPAGTPAPRRAGLTGSDAFEAPIPRRPAPPVASPRAGTAAHPDPTAHPQSTPDAALLGEAWAAVSEPGAPAARGRSSAASPATAAGLDWSATTSPRLPAPEPSPWSDSPFTEGLPPELELPREETLPLAAAPAPEAAPLEQDPFAAAAAHVARLAGDEPPAPAVGSPYEPAAAFPAPSPRTPTAALPAPPPPEPSSPAIPRPQAPTTPVRPEPVPGAAPEDETSVELSASEQYEIPRVRRHEPRLRRGSVPARVGVAVFLSAAVGLAGAAAAWYFLQQRGAIAVGPAVTTATPTPMPAPPPPAPPAPAEPEPVTPPTPPTPAVANAEPTPPPAEEPRPPTAAERRAETKAEAARMAAERRAETDRLAAERKAEAERKDAERRAAAERKAQADRQVQADRNEAERSAAAERKAEADRQAEKKVAAATAAEPAVEEALRKKEPAPDRPAEPLAEGLDPAQMQAVIRGNRAALEACVQGAVSDPATSVYAGRKVSLIILVAPNGKAEAALEDTDLDASAFGACLRRAAAKMAFPPFRGEPVGARIPLVIGRAE